MSNLIIKHILPAFIASSLTLASCGSDKHDFIASNVLSDDTDDADVVGQPDGLNLSLSTPAVIAKFSMLTDLAKATKLQNSRDINYPVCVFGNHKIDKDSLIKGYTAIERALNRWNQALKIDETWPVTTITVEAVGDTASCPILKGGLRVLKVFSDVNNTRPNNNPSLFLITTSANKEPYRLGDDQFYKVVLHEIGHQFGLGDAYTEAGYQTPENQPPSVMNSLWDVDDLTQDDVVAINHVWQLLTLRTTATCPAGYMVGAAGENKFRNTFCVPAKPVATVEFRTFANKCLTVVPGIFGTKIKQSDCTGDKNQLFNAARSDTKVYMFQSQANGQCLDINFAMPFNSVKAITFPCHGRTNQQFKLQSQREAEGPGIVNLVAMHSNKCLDIAWGSRDNGAAAIQYRCHNKNNQKFLLRLTAPQQK